MYRNSAGWRQATRFVSLAALLLCLTAATAAYGWSADGDDTNQLGADADRVPVVAASLPGLPDVATAVPLSSVPATGGHTGDFMSAEQLSLANRVWSFSLAAGDEVSFVARAQGDLDVDILLYGPGTTTIYGTPPVAHSTFHDYWPPAAERGDFYPEHLSFVALTPGTYYVDLWCKAGGMISESALLDWAIWPAEEDDVLPGITATGTPLLGSLDELTDPSDFWALPELRGGNQLVVSATSSQIDDLDIALWDPFGRPDPDLTNARNWDCEPGASAEIIHDAGYPYSAEHPVWLQVHGFTGSGAYQVEWAIYHAGSVWIGNMDPVVVPYGGTGTLNGWVHDAYSQVNPAGVQVVIYSSTGGAWTREPSVTTDSSGRFTFSRKPSVATAYSPSIEPNHGMGYVDSDNVGWIVPRCWVGDPVAPKTMSHTRSYTVYGYLKPRHSRGSKVRIYKWKKTSTGRWKSYGYVTAYTDYHSSYSEYSRKIRLTSPGKWRLRAYMLEDSGHADAWSSGVDYVTVK